MKSIRKKQMVVLLLVTVVIAAGILQYNYNKNNLSSGVTGDNLDSDFVSGDVQVRDADQVSKIFLLFSTSTPPIDIYITET
jgi:hypothetical protein